MYLGLDIGGTNIKAGIIDSNDNLIFNDSYKLKESSDPVLFIENVHKFITEIRTSHIDIKSIGIGVPGVVSEAGMVLVSPNIPALDRLPVADKISKFTNLPIIVDNDANVAAYAELAGAGKNDETFLYVTLGTGVGGGIIYKREIFRGTEGGAGEIGHMIIDINQKIENFVLPYRTGTLEEFTGRKPILALAKELLLEYPDSSLNKIKDLDVVHISDAANKKEPAAIAILERIGYFLGIGFASALNLLGIYTLIIGGGISQADEILFETIRKTVKLRAMPTVADNFVIKIAQYKNDAGIMGAALLGKSLII